MLWNDPWEEFRKMEEELDRYFRERGIDRGERRPTRVIEHRYETPVYDVLDKGDSYCIMIELPGVEKDDVTVKVREDRLDVTAPAPAGVDERKKGYACTIRLDEPVDGEHAEATFNNGIVTLVIPKRERRHVDLR
jgi:HSP20 family protein